MQKIEEVIVGKIAGLAQFGLEVGRRFFRPQMSHVNIMVNNRCNQRCLTCNIWESELKRDISRDQVRNILNANDLMWVTLTGGEPSLSPCFSDILAVCLHRTQLVHLNTNGLQSQKIISAVKFALGTTKQSFLLVNLSLFGNRGAHDMITRTKGSYSSVMATLHGLKALENDRLILGFAHTICKYNIGQIPFIEALGKHHRVGVTYAWERHIPFFHNADGDNFLPEFPKPNLTLNPISLFKNALMMNTRRTAGCVAGEYSCWIGPDLNVYPCFWDVPEKKVFNLAETGYSLDTTRFKPCMTRVKACKGCWIACESYAMLMWRPWRLIK